MQVLLLSQHCSFYVHVVKLYVFGLVELSLGHFHLRALTRSLYETLFQLFDHVEAVGHFGFRLNLDGMGGDLWGDDVQDVGVFH